ncbi:hypothetical protein ACP70R_020988 [Stipagrostis hirtigluma subsp. patula]
MAERHSSKRRFDELSPPPRGAGFPSGPPPTGLPFLPPPAGHLPSFPPPAGTPFFPPPAGTASFPPHAAARSFPPPAGLSSFPPPAGLPSYPSPAGFSSGPPSKKIQLVQQRTGVIAAKRPRVPSYNGSLAGGSLGGSGLSGGGSLSPQSFSIIDGHGANIPLLTSQSSRAQSVYQAAGQMIGIPNERVGVIIGKSSHTVTSGTLQLESAITKVMPVSSAPTILTELSGTSEHKSKAEQLTSDVVPVGNNGSSGYNSGQTYNTEPESKVQIQMKIPNSKVGRVFGKNHHTLNSLMSRSGARIEIIPSSLPHGDTSTERTVLIEGIHEHVEKAKELVNEVISEGYCPPVLPWGYKGNPPIKQPGYGYRPPGAFPRAPKHVAPLQYYARFFPSSGWDQSLNQHSHLTLPATASYYNQQQPAKHQQFAPGTVGTTDASSYNYGQPVAYAPQCLGDTTYSHRSGKQQAASSPAAASYTAYACQQQTQLYGGPQPVTGHSTQPPAGSAQVTQSNSHKVYGARPPYGGTSSAGHGQQQPHGGRGGGSE